jgi:hypothetical protein
MDNSPSKLLEGLRDAVAGNWSRATIGGQVWERVDGIKKAGNAGAWAIGNETKRGFNIRRVVWGRMLARAEKRKGEEIRKAVIYVAFAKKGKP